MTRYTKRKILNAIDKDGIEYALEHGLDWKTIKGDLNFFKLYEKFMQTRKEIFDFLNSSD